MKLRAITLPAYFIHLFHLVQPCSWPTSDVLFVIDGTLSLNSYEHLNELDFIRKSIEFMTIGSDAVKLAVAQYTPRSRVEFGLDQAHDGNEAENRLKSIGYTPCDPLTSNNCTPIATLTTIARQALLPANRKPAPDVIVVLGSSKYTLQNVGEREVLFSPISPIHTFQITVGGNAPDNDKFEGAATLIRMHSVDFTSLEKLVQPLCESVESFVGHSTSSVFGQLCWLVTVILLLILLLLICVSGYFINNYRQEVELYRRRLQESERAIKSQNEYFTSKLHSQMEEQIASSKKHAEDLRKQQETLTTQQLELQRHWQTSTTPSQPAQPIIVPYYPAKENDQNEVEKSKNRVTRGIGSANTIHFTFDGKEVEIKNGRISTRFLDDSIVSKVKDGSQPENHKENHEKVEEDQQFREIPIDAAKPKEHSTERHHEDGGGDSPKSPSHTKREEKYKQASEDDSSQEGNTDSEETDSIPTKFGSSLPPDHPARTLPPVDILFLVDSSSSIGITNFDAMKENISRLLDNIDIAPGRSRAALIQYAQEPSVVFGFDKYYSINSVKKGVQRMSYTGGCTMLAKALSFAAGILFNEQNMKDVKKKSKLMPTPRHDRLQILCVVSDGASDDNIDKSTTYIHERLQVKVLGMVSKSFNKDKLLSVTRFEGSVFVMSQTESMSIWIWRQQKLWAENYGKFIKSRQQ